MRIYLKIWLVFVWSILQGNISYSQVDLSRYLDESALPLLNLNDHLTVAFKWDMRGNVQAALNEGINNLNEGQIRLAISNFDEVVKLDPALWVSYYYRGIGNKKLHQFPEAERDLGISKKLNSNQPEIYLELGEVYQLKRDFKLAASQYTKALSINPKLVTGYFSLGNLAVMEGEPKKALDYYSKCNEVDPKFAGAYMMEGILRFRQKKDDPASLGFFNKAIDADSSYSQTYFWRGLTFAALDKPEKAIEDWNKLVRYNPSNFFYLLMRGFLFIELKRFEEAFVDVRKGLAAQAVNEDKFSGQQTLLDKHIDLQTAANYLIRNGYGLREQAFIHLKTGFCLLLSGRYLEAYNAFVKSLRIQESSCVMYLIAIAFEHSKQHEQAYTFYSNALRLDPDIFDAYKKRSIYKYELKDWNGAYSDIKEMFRLQPGSPVAYRLRGLIKSNEGDYLNAIGDLTVFLKTDSTDVEAIRTRGVCKQLSKDLKGANEDYLRILTLNPQDASFFDLMAKNCIAMKDTSCLISVYRRQSANFKDLTPYFELIKIFIDSKKIDLALDEIVKVKKVLAPDKDLNPTLVSRIIYYEGMIEFRKLAYNKAITKFNQALDKDRTNLEALYYRAKGYELIGQPKKAVTDYYRLKAFHFRDSEQLYQAINKE